MSGRRIATSSAVRRACRARWDGGSCGNCGLLHRWSAGRALATTPLSAGDCAMGCDRRRRGLAWTGVVISVARAQRKPAVHAFVVAMRTERARAEDCSRRFTPDRPNHCRVGQNGGDLMGLGDATATRLAAVTAALPAIPRRQPHGLFDAQWKARAPTWESCWRACPSQSTGIAHGRGVAPADSIRSDQTERSRVLRVLECANRAMPTHDTHAASRLVQHLTRSKAPAPPPRCASAKRAMSPTPGSTPCSNARPIRCPDPQRDTMPRRPPCRPCSSRRKRSLGRAGIEASHALSQRLDRRGFFARRAHRAHRRAGTRIAALVADLDNGLVALDDRFARPLAEQGDERAGRLSGHVGRLRADSTNSGSTREHRIVSARVPTAPPPCATASPRCRWRWPMNWQRVRRGRSRRVAPARRHRPGSSVDRNGCRRGQRNRRPAPCRAASRRASEQRLSTLLVAVDHGVWARNRTRGPCRCDVPGQ